MDLNVKEKKDEEEEEEEEKMKRSLILLLVIISIIVTLPASVSGSLRAFVCEPLRKTKTTRRPSAAEKPWTMQTRKERD